MTARRIGAAVVLAGAAAALAAGCGGSSSPKSTTAAAAKPFIVLVTDVNQLNDHGFNQLAYQGLKRAQRELGINGAVYQSPSAQAYIPNLAQAARKGAALVISVGGQKQPPVDRYIAGYRAGAQAADPGIKLLNAYSQDWVDQAKCKQAALDQIAAGASIVFQVAGGCGLGALDAAKEKGVWGIGVDADQSYLGKEVLTSAMKRVDTSVYATIQQVVAGHFAGGTNSVFSLKNDGVGLGKISPKVPKSDVQKLQQIAKDVAAGKIANIPTTFS